MERVELAIHTGYSKKDGIGLAKEWVEFAILAGVKTLVITDNGCVDSFMDFQNFIEYKKADIKLIMGADLSVYDDRDNGYQIDPMRISVLIKNEKGKKNLYKILKIAEKAKKDANAEVLVPLSLILNNKEGLVVGSNCKSRDFLIKSLIAIEKNKIKDEVVGNSLAEIFRMYDYIEISDMEDEKEIGRLLAMADVLKIPAVIVSAPHYSFVNHDVSYSVLKNDKSIGKRHYKTTAELLDKFKYLGEDLAYELIVENSNKISDMCEEVKAVGDKKRYPLIENQDEILKDVCKKALNEKHPDANEDIKNRLKWELEAIKSSKSAFMFLQIMDVYKQLDLKPFEVGSRGNVGTSMVAYLCGISEVDPIKANLTPYFFYGYDGKKEPDIDLNFRYEIKEDVREAFKNAPGVGNVIKAGTYGTISTNVASNMIYDYSKANETFFNDNEVNKFTKEMEWCVNSRGQHPGGLILLPEGMDIEEICPVTNIGDSDNEVIVSSYDYHSMDHILYKFDALGHDAPEVLKRLYELTGVDPRSISTDDKDVMSLFNVSDEKIPKCAGIPEFNNEYVWEGMKIAKPECFNDLVKMSAIMHGTDTWEDNAKELLLEGKATIKEILADRNDVYDALIGYGLDEKDAFDIAENVRKGKVSRKKDRNWDEEKALMISKNVPEWFIESCEKIKYMFPRAHAYSYTLSAWRMAWYKLHYPLEFYKVMLDVYYKSGFDYEFMTCGKEKLKNFIEFLDSRYADYSPMISDTRKTAVFLNDFYDHGYTFKIEVLEGYKDYEFDIIDSSTIGVKIYVRYRR